MIRFKIFKNKILTRAKEQRACIIGYDRALKAQTFEELMGVIKDYFRWSVRHKIIDEKLIRKYRKEFNKNDIFCNEDVHKGFLLVTGNAKVVTHGYIVTDALYDDCFSTKVEAYGNSTVYAHDTKVEARDNAKVCAYGNSLVYAYDNSTVYAYDSSTVATIGNNVKVIYKRPFSEPSNPTPEKEEKEPTELDIAEFLLHELVELLKKLGLFEKLEAYYREKHTNTHP